MIIWGWRTVFRTVATGTFHCPNEGGDRTYRQRSARRWFTLFFIPVIPLRQLGTFVECDGCGRRYDNAVLTAPTAAQLLDRLSTAMRHAAVRVLRAGGRDADEPSRMKALAAIQRFADSPYLDADLSRDLMELDTGGVEVMVGRLSQSLSAPGREGFLEACVAICAASGSVGEEERALLDRLASALEISGYTLRGMLETAVEEGSGTEPHREG